MVKYKIPEFDESRFDQSVAYDVGPQIGNEFPITCQDKMDLDARWIPPPT